MRIGMREPALANDTTVIEYDRERGGIIFGREQGFAVVCAALALPGASADGLKRSHSRHLSIKRAADF
jgi:hypothetical protein